MATLARPHGGIPITELTAAVRQFEVCFRMAEDSPLVTAQLLAFLEQGYSTQVHDTHIVATMQAVGAGRIAVKVINHLSDEVMKVCKVR